LIYVKSLKKFTPKYKNNLKKFWWFGKKSYLCIRFRPENGLMAQEEEFFERFT